MEERKKLFNLLYNFARKIPIHFICAKVKKSECRDSDELDAKLTKAIMAAVSTSRDYWNTFDSVSVADYCEIYDAYSFISSLDYDSSEISQIDFRAVRDLTDKESTKGVTGSIREFFNKWHFDRYDLTVIKIENNMITEVYFDF